MRWVIATQPLTEKMGSGSKVPVDPPRIRANSVAGFGEVAHATLTPIHESDEPVMTALSFNSL